MMNGFYFFNNSLQPNNYIIYILACRELLKKCKMVGEEPTRIYLAIIKQFSSPVEDHLHSLLNRHIPVTPSKTKFV